MIENKKFKIFNFNYHKEDKFTGKYHDKVITGYLREYRETIQEMESRTIRFYFFQRENNKLFVGCDVDGNILRKDEWVDYYNWNPITKEELKEND